ncbi:alpha/beta fold hydrolase [Streptomyces sp. WI04-05B]|uniref:alpha/beta fold hydrolase n=1 Tax=Streptomyces TaxID=1883 RepID=UPI0029B03D63|nr:MULTISPECIES: alpha/beta hydrolase [unclassified Streptomyces]MDX2545909.1 alpha/beta hydrolase [Streptomyces sp. WI04-05B]MDX2586468.1 alpha/beta hydrolase [Streptomyces sp. WI04-05A]
MSEFVLVPGTWLGSSAWDEVAVHLRAAGHGAHPLTLSGLAERRAEPTGQQAHVRDIVEEIERLDLRDVVLVGHGYAGIPVGQAAGRIGDRLARVVFVDASLPTDGQPFLTGWALMTLGGSNNGSWRPLQPDDFAHQGLTDEHIARIVAGSTPHPGTTLTEPAVLTRPLDMLPTTYIQCLLDHLTLPPRVVELLKSDRWELFEMFTGHWPMYSEPCELAAILLQSASRG